MCHIEVAHYRCGHKKEGKVRKCQLYYEKKAEARFSLCSAILGRRQPRHCGHLRHVNTDDGSVCSAECASRIKEVRQKAEREKLRRRKEEEREERERRERRIQRHGELKKAISDRGGIKPLWQTGRGGTDVHTGSTRIERQRAPPRLAERQLLSQTHHPRNPTTTTTPGPPLPRSQANMNPQGGRVQATQNQQRMPLASRTPNDPRVHGQAWQRPGLARPRVQVPPAQTVACRKPVVVNPPAGIPEPSRPTILSAATASSSSVRRPSPGNVANRQIQTQASHEPRRAYRQGGPPVPPKDRPSVPPKDAWGPQHLNMVPAPLSIRSKQPVRAARAPEPQPSGRLHGYRSDPTMNMPRRKPVEVSTPSMARERVARPQPAQPAQQSSLGVPGYRPNPMFARNPGNKNPEEVGASKKPQGEVKGRPQAPSNTAAARAPAASWLKSTKPGSSSAPQKQNNKPGWFKKLMSSDSSDQSVEWVSLDAARVERSVPSKW